MNARFVPLLLGLLIAVAACSSEKPADVDAAAPMPDASVTPTCAPDQTMCNGTCAPLKRDHDNCGMCGKACKDGEVCVQGGCALQCGGGSSKCGSQCVRLDSDPGNCGMCGTKCATGEVCSLKKCAQSCEDGFTNCNQACLDLMTDDDNCGMCGMACGAGQRCTNGQCTATCQQGWTSCPNDGGTTCVDTRLDNANCGMCGNACPMGQMCSPGADGGGSTCGLTCFGGTTKCGNQCADLAIDPQHCGGCNQPCNGTCFNGMCCSGNQIYCNGACRDFKTDAQNCGGCGVACGGVCNNGVCCGVNDVICNGKCTNTKSDPQNCNGCGNVCPMNTPSCVNGVCSVQLLNLSLGGTMTSSGGGANQYAPATAKDGVSEVQSCSAFCWVSASNMPTGSWLQVTFASSKTVVSMNMDTQSGTMNNQCNTLGRTLGYSEIQYWNGNSWVQDGIVSGKLDDWTYTFAQPRVTTQVRLFNLYATNTMGQQGNPIAFEWQVMGF